VLAVWRDHAENVRGHPINSGHFLPEEAPEETYQALRGFSLGKGLRALPFALSAAGTPRHGRSAASPILSAATPLAAIRRSPRVTDRQLRLAARDSQSACPMQTYRERSGLSQRPLFVAVQADAALCDPVPCD